jgi:hypothetical protein
MGEPGSGCQQRLHGLIVGEIEVPHLSPIKRSPRQPPAWIQHNAAKARGQALRIANCNLGIAIPIGSGD